LRESGDGALRTRFRRLKCAAQEKIANFSFKADFTRVARPKLKDFKHLNLTIEISCISKLDEMSRATRTSRSAIIENLIDAAYAGIETGKGRTEQESNPDRVIIVPSKACAATELRKRSGDPKLPSRKAS
jgi:hypothetical protein